MVFNNFCMICFLTNFCSLSGMHSLNYLFFCFRKGYRIYWRIPRTFLPWKSGQNRGCAIYADTRFPAPSLNTPQERLGSFCAHVLDVQDVQDVSARGAEPARLYTSVLRSVYVGAVFKLGAGKRVSAYIAHPGFCPDFQGKKVCGIRQ